MEMVREPAGDLNVVIVNFNNERDAHQALTALQDPDLPADQPDTESRRIAANSATLLRGMLALPQTSSTHRIILRRSWWVQNFLEPIP
jgi:hypothetical protein